MKKELKTELIQFRMDKSEKEKLLEQAAQLDLTVSEYIRLVVLNAKVEITSNI